MRRVALHLAGAAALLTLAVLLGWTRAADAWAGQALAGDHAVWAWVTRLGDSVVLAAAGAAAAGLLWALRGRVEALVMAGLTVAQWVATWSLKYLVGRDRPAGTLDPSSPAFPSGHTLGATAVYVGMAVLADAQQARAIVAAGSLAFLVGWSRVALGMHHATDVLGGWLVGAALVILAHDLRSTIRQARDGEPHPAEPPGSRGPPGAS